MLKILLAMLLMGTLEIGACADWNSPTTPISLSQQVAAGDRYMGMRLLGALRLSAAPVNDLAPRGLSGLAWDEDAGLLYALADSGSLFHLRPIFSAGLLTDVQIVAAYPLLNAKGKPLRPPLADSESLAITKGSNGVPGDSVLIVSFEGQPRIARYTPTGKWLQDESLPPSLRDADRYANSNKALESLTLHGQWGLLTAPEWPLREGPTGYVPIFSLTAKRSWLYPLYKAPNSALVDMTALPDGSLLTLERAFVSLLHPVVISLRRTSLPANPTKPLQVEEVAVFDTSQGWLLDNFEGLARHREQRFFMVSDDNRSALQSTLLVYFELLSSPGGSGQ